MIQAFYPVHTFQAWDVSLESNPKGNACGTELDNFFGLLLGAHLHRRWTISPLHISE